MPENYLAQLVSLAKKISSNAQKIAKRAENLESGGKLWKKFFASGSLNTLSVDAFTLRSSVLDLLHTIEYIRGGDTPKTAEINRVINNLTADSDIDELEDFIDEKPDDAAMEDALVREKSPAKPGHKRDKLDKLLLMLDPHYQEYLNESRYKRPSESQFDE